MKKLLLCMAVAVATIGNAQQFEVVEIQRIKTGAQQAFHPRFMPDGKTLLVTSEAYDGLAIVDMEKGTYNTLTTMDGAGWLPAISEDGKTILTRCKNEADLSHTIYTLDVATKNLTVVAENIEHVNNLGFDNGVATIGIEGKAVVKTVSRALTPVRKADNILLTNEDLKLVLYRNGVRTVLDPLKGQFGTWDTQYCWASLSPDRTRILFYCYQNAYTCNLDGSNVVKVGEIQAPQWRGNDHVVGMNDEHDGYFNTKSDIVISRVDGTQLQQLTPASSEIKMFPSVSADGSQIAFHTEDGKIYVMTIKEK